MSPESRQSIEIEWRRIEKWIAHNAPSWTDAGRTEPLFHGPAPDHAIGRLKQHVGAELPEVRALLRVCDGCRRGSYPLVSRATRPTTWRTLSSSEMASEWDRLEKTAKLGPARDAIRSIGPVHTVWWDPGWVPLGECGMGDILCVDTNPAPGGTAGQLILYEHDFGERKVLYPALVDWLQECANDLEGGAYAYEPGVGLVARKRDQ